MNESKIPLVFRPNNEDQQIIDEYNINSWTDFCRENLQNLKTKNRNELVDYISNKLLLIIVGLIPLALSFLILDPVFIIICYIAATTAISIGFAQILWRWHIERRKHVQ